MKLNQKALALASGLVSAVVSILCVILIAIVPVQTMNVFGWLAHINNLATLVGPRDVSLSGATIGIIVSFLVAYITGWLFAVLYNRFAK